MEIKINIKKRHLYIFAGLIGILIGIFLVNAYNSGGPASTFGHSTEEVNWAAGVVANIFQVNGSRITVRNGPQGIHFIADEANSRLHIDVGGAGHARDDILLGDLVDPYNAVVTNGDVGIGTLTPAAKLDVAGKIRMPASNFYRAQGSCTVPPGTSFCTATASCNSGDVATGGGGDSILAVSIPDSSGRNWDCTINAAQGTTVTCYARCFDIN